MPEQASFAVRNFAEAIYKKVYGFDPQEALKAAQREAAAAAAAAQREAEERERERIIFALNQVSNIPVTQIATALNVPVEYVENVIQRALAEQTGAAIAAEGQSSAKEKTPRRRTTDKNKK